MANPINPGKNQTSMLDVAPSQLGSSSTEYKNSESDMNASSYRNSGSDSAGKSNILDKEEIKQQASRLTEQAREKTETYVSGQKEVIADQLVGIADAVRQTARYLSDNNKSSIAQYAEQAAQGMDRFTNNLRQQDLRSILTQSEEMARKQPALFFGISIGVGLLLSRFIKSSASTPDVSPSIQNDTDYYQPNLDQDFENTDVQRSINENPALKGL